MNAQLEPRMIKDGRLRSQQIRNKTYELNSLLWAALLKMTRRQWFRRRNDQTGATKWLWLIVLSALAVALAALVEPPRPL